MNKRNIVVMSGLSTTGIADCGVELISIPQPPDPDLLKEDDRTIDEIMATKVACRLIDCLGNSDVIFLQHRAGDVTCGGQINANNVLQQIPFDQVARATGETEEEVRKRLIIFATSLEEAEENMPIIDLHYLDATEMKLPLSVLKTRWQHPLSKILRLAEAI